MAARPSLQELLANAENLPSVPAVAAEVLRITHDENASTEILAEALSLDPALSSRLLRLANSALFSMGSPVSSLQRAAIVLGLKTVRLMALGFSLLGSLPRGGAGPFDFREYWRRSVVRAVATRTLASGARSPLVDEAFVAGLMARIGQLTLGHGVPDRWRAIREQAGEGWPGPDAERAVLGFDSAAIAGALLEDWGLPSLIVDAIRFSTDPDAAGSGIPPAHRWLARTLQLGGLCEELVQGGDPTPLLQEIGAGARTHLGIAPDALEDLLRGLGDSIAVAADLLDVRMRTVCMDDILRRAHDQMARELVGLAGQVHAAERRAAQLEESNRTLFDRASNDSLTGLPNRGFFDECFARCGEDRKRGVAKEALGVLMIDVDHFKRVNDAWGHTAGDRVLQVVARAIRSVVREDELAARYGGEEFVALLPSVSARGLAAAAERIRASVERTRVEVDGQQLAVTASVGGAMTADADAAGEPLLEAADRALYEAKRGGRNRCVIASEAQVSAGSRSGASR